MPDGGDAWYCEEGASSSPCYRSTTECSLFAALSSTKPKQRRGGFGWHCPAATACAPHWPVVGDVCGNIGEEGLTATLVLLARTMMHA